MAYRVQVESDWWSGVSSFFRLKRIYFTVYLSSENAIVDDDEVGEENNGNNGTDEICKANKRNILLP